jgi:hypothetical protein
MAKRPRQLLFLEKGERKEGFRNTIFGKISN